MNIINKTTIAMSWLKDKIKILGLIYRANEMNKLNFEPEIILDKQDSSLGKASPQLDGKIKESIYALPRLMYK